MPRSFPSAQVSADADYGLSCIELERLRCSAGLPSSVQHLCQQQMCLGGGSRTPQHNVTSLPPMRGFHTWCAGAQSRSSNSSVNRSIKLLLHCNSVTAPMLLSQHTRCVGARITMAFTHFHFVSSTVCALIRNFYALSAVFSPFLIHNVMVADNVKMWVGLQLLLQSLQ